MQKSEIFNYYSSDYVAEQLAMNAQDREVAYCFENGAYDQRPAVLQYKSDIMPLVKKGITSFHYSVEHWTSPMALSTGMQASRYSELRKGWDLIIDMDSKIGMIGSQLCAAEIMKFLKRMKVQNAGIKFSGSRGFHICLTWNMFPQDVNFKPLSKQYPDIPRILVNFIRENIKESLMKSLLAAKPAKELLELIGEAPSELSPFFFVDVENTWGSRHMFRAPFSLNEKKWLVSVPINENQIKDFSESMALPKNVVKQKHPLFFRGQENEAEGLLIQALDWFSKQPKELPRKDKKVSYENKIPEEMFPPCIKLAFQGLADGRKRTVFTLANFLRMMNWSWPEIEDRMLQWNEKNAPPLQTNLILTQIRSYMRNEYKPGNCDSGQFITSIGLCQPDVICKSNTDKITIKNPIAYPIRIMSKRKKERQKEERKTDAKNKKKGLPQYKCSRCDSAFEKMKGLNMHIGRVHGE